MIAELLAHLWQSTFFALAAALLALAFRRNRAHVRYWIWLSASIKFFLPFALLMSLGSQLHWAPAAHRLATNIAEQITPAISDTLEQFNQPLFPVKATAPAAIPWISIAGFVWLCGFAAITLMRFRTWRRIHTAVRTSSATNISAPVEVRSSAGLLEPGVVGLFRPILLLPDGIVERLSPSELQAVLAHELCHIRRRDNLLATLHMLVEAMFWFHPLVWWIGARLVEERERACDEEVIRQGNHPDVYADAILNVCKLYTESPLSCVSGVTGASIRRRVEAIMMNPARHALTRTRKIVLTGLGTAALLGPVAVGLILGLGHTPAIHAQKSAPPETPVQIAQAPTAAKTSPQPPPHAVPKFDVASIRPCAPGDDVFAGGRGGGGAGRGGMDRSPGRLRVGCETVAQMVENAYAIFGGEPVVNNDSILLTPGRVRGGPAWIQSDRYTIEAATADPVANGPTNGLSPADLMLMGRMLQSLLEDRFQLKLHRETEPVPMYALSVAKTGPKLKLTEEGSCVPPLPPGQPSVPVRADGKPWCGRVVTSVNGPDRVVSGSSITMGRLVQSLALDRRVLDQTGIPGNFDIRLEFAPDETTPCDRPSCAVDPTSSIPPGPSIFTALEQQLGLKLEPIKGPHGFIVIDKVEHPSEN